MTANHDERPPNLACLRVRLQRGGDSVGSNTTSGIRYAFRRPRFPIICALGNELLLATSPAAFQRQIERWNLQRAKVLDIVDATGEGWAFHADLTVVSPLTLKKRWKKIEVIRLFNESDNARRIGAAYPEAWIPRRSLVQIIAEVAALAARGAARPGCWAPTSGGQEPPPGT